MVLRPLLLHAHCGLFVCCSKVYKAVVRGHQRLIAKITHAAPLQVSVAQTPLHTSCTAATSIHGFSRSGIIMLF
jgi:hypothetical protein